MNERSVRHAWERFLVGSGDVTAAVRPQVLGSWQRSKNFNIDVRRQAAPILSEGELYRKRSENALLTASARLATERTSGILAEAGSMLILTDGVGHIIETIGDGRTIESGREVHLENGGCWSEQKIGTNGIGAAIVARAPVQIHASEHFCEQVQRWTCAAAPIFHPVDRELLGVIDISGPSETFSSQNLALVVSLADHIEGVMSQSIRLDHTRLMTRFHEKQRKWMSHEMMAIDRRGSIVQSSLDAMRMISEHDGPSPCAGDLSFLKSVPFGEWEDRLARIDPDARVVLVRDGSTELGAIIVFPARIKSVMASRPRGRSASARYWSDETFNNPEPAAVRPGLRDRLPAGPKVFSGAKHNAAKMQQDKSTVSLGFVALDPGVKAICNNVAAAAQMKMPILICGQTGTGKEKLARFAHSSSGRKGAFIAVNCSALPDSLIEAELFGYADGAFTGARKGGSQGLVREAHGGTLFLDEIGDMPFTLQSVLLRFLDDSIVRPVGGTSTKVDLLVVSATNVDLGLAITSRRFRADLLYRLNTLHVTLPLLADRADVEAIAMYLLGEINPDMQITDTALATLARQSWQGNARELKSTLARLSLAAKNCLIDEALVTSMVANVTAQSPGNGSLRESQRARMLEVFAETGGNISETARRLNVCRNTVYRGLGSQVDK